MNIRRWLRVAGLVGIGIVVGIGLGLYLGWVAWPTEFTDANPSVLQEDYRRDYTLMIAATYAADGNLTAAQQRVTNLGEDGRDFLLSLLLDMSLQGGEETEIRQLARLAADLELSSPVIEPFLTPTTGVTP